MKTFNTNTNTNNNNNNNNNNIRGPTMPYKDKGGGGGVPKELLDFIQNTNKRRCYKHYGEKMSGPESSPTELSTEMAFPLRSATESRCRRYWWAFTSPECCLILLLRSSKNAIEIGPITPRDSIATGTIV